MKTTEQLETIVKACKNLLFKMSTKPIVVAILFIAMVSCKKEEDIDNGHLSAELTVYTTNSWTAENPSLSTVSGAMVSFYVNEASFDTGIPDYTFTTDENGKAMCYDLAGSTLYFVVENGAESNIHTTTMGNFLIAGVFQSQEEIDDFLPYQTGASVGGIKYADLNADGVINTDDRTLYDYIVLSSGKTVFKDVIIGK